MRLRGGHWLALGAALVLPAATAAFVLSGVTWPSATATFRVNIPEQGGIFNDPFEEAMAEWGASGQFGYQFNPSSGDPCNTPPSTQNGVGFEPDFCGDAWGANTLAATTTWFTGTTIVLAGIAYNQTFSWDVYEGPRDAGGPWDFRRVGVHELGHALGLDHTTLFGIMVPAIGNNEVPEFDDWNGVAAMYGGGVVPDVLAVSPRGAFTPTGPPGGPFGAELEIYALRNTGAATFSFLVSDTASWTTIDGASGTLAPGASTIVGVWINSGATALGAGLHSSTLTFDNTTSGNGTVAQLVDIDVGPDDSDADGVLNAADNCVAVPNAPQANSDPLSAGDLCQCGDLNSDWQVDALDRAIIVRLGAGRPVGVANDRRRCSVAGFLTVCDLTDSAAVQGWLARVVTDLPNLCEAAIVP